MTYVTFTMWRNMMERSPSTFSAVSVDDLSYWTPDHKAEYFRRKCEFMEKMERPVQEYLLDNFDSFDPEVHNSYHDYILDLLKSHPDNQNGSIS